MAQRHERMPVILEAADWPLWLDETEGRPTTPMRPAPDDVLRLWPVSRAVNTVRSNGTELLDRIDDPHAPPPSGAPHQPATKQAGLLASWPACGGRAGSHLAAGPFWCRLPRRD
jgi:hypothetical protein